MIAKMIHFYRLTPSEVETMQTCDANILYRAITVIEAQEMLKQLKVSSYPKMGKEDQQKLHRTLHKQAYPDQYSVDKTVKAEDMAKILSGMING